MQLAAATLWLLTRVFLVTGSIFFPLSSVSVTLSLTTVLPNPLPPLVQLVLLRDVPDYLTNITELNVERYELIDDQSDGLFFVKGNELRVHSRFFSANYSIPRSADHFSLKIAGYLDDDGPTFMWVNVSLSETELICAQRQYDLCFWSAQTFQMAEGLDETVLGPLTSPLNSALCPKFSVEYSVNKGNSSKWLTVQRHENGLGGWVLALSDWIDYEKISVVSAKINCTVMSDNYPSSHHVNEISVKIRDVDDNSPKVRFQISQLLGQHISLNEKLALGRIDDLDSPEINDLDITVSSNDWNMSITCYSKSNSSTFMSCVVFSLDYGDFVKSIRFSVTVTDKKLSPGYGIKKIVNHYVIHPLTPRMESLVDDTPTYASATIQLPGKAQNWSRVAAPMSHVSSLYRFYLRDDRFNVTEKEGIVYVKNSQLLNKQELIILKMEVIGENRPKLFYNISIEVTKPIVNTGKCRKKIQRLEKNEGFVEWCSELSNPSDCFKFCGNGVRFSVGHGSGCHWRHILADGGQNYSTCSVDAVTCPDGRCDALERMRSGLCPQDCTRSVKGAGNKKADGLGIAHAEGICHWDPDGDWCQCSKEYNATYDNIPPSELLTICDITCQTTIGIVLLLLIVLIIVLVLFYIRKHRRMKKRNVSRPAKEELVTMNYEEYVRRPLREPEPARPDYFDAKWEFPRHRLSIEETIGEGEFGMVLKARADGIQSHDGPMIVAVKTLKNAAKDSELEDLVSELELLKDVDHPNVIKLLGACTSEGGPLYVIIEYAEHGSLRNYLRKHRPSTIDGDKEDSCYLEGVSPLTPRHILTFAWHIAKGMAYLTEMKLVHRDLAARNVLLTKDLVCKISDFGLTRDIYEDDTYLKRSKGRVPIKWMALESLADHVYTSKSDVWSYGVLLWELVTRGSSPYPGVAAQNLFNLLQDGYRMERPPGCSIELYALMRACWARSPQHRPSFAGLVAQLDSMLAAGREYLDLCSGAVENRQYMENAPQWVFQTYDQPRPTCECSIDHCSHLVRYENEIRANINSNNDKDIAIVHKL